MRSISLKHCLIIFVSWTVVQGGLLHKTGIVDTGEAIQYITGGQELLATGRIPDDLHLYAVQTALLAMDQMLGCDFVFAEGIQLLFNFISVLSFYRLLINYVNPRVALAWTLILLAILPYQQFNMYLQTESLYYSFSVIYTSFLLRVRSLSITVCLSLATALMLLGVTRPTGFIYTLATLMFLAARFGSPFRRGRVAFLFCTCILCIIAVFGFASTGGRFNFIRPFITDQVICLVPTTTAEANLRLDGNQHNIASLFYYVIRNPLHFSELAMRKAAAFFGLIRTYYSTIHNAFLVCSFYPLYLLCVRGTRKMSHIDLASAIYLVTLVVLSTVSVVLTCDDWHNRFFLHLTTYLLLLAAFAGSDGSKIQRV